MLVFDELDSILLQGDRYQPGYENYADLFQRIVTSRHQSCLLLTSWHQPLELNSLVEQSSHIKLLQLNGLDEQSALKILYSAKRFSSSTENKSFSEIIFREYHPIDPADNLSYTADSARFFAKN
ncbi:MAG: hypothetical protein EAZ96_25685 [Oscillatoriales cyanobacterium]|nr:MAG: hypothetical protein EAZ96_25685 [Oscillatoriales cyanobacterium]